MVADARVWSYVGVESYDAVAPDDGGVFIARGLYVRALFMSLDDRMYIASSHVE